jgi:hypothetical protein
LNNFHASAEKPINNARIYLRVLLVVFALSVITILSFLWAINSQSFAKKVVKFAISKLSSNKTGVTVEGVSGSFVEGLIIKRIVYKNSSAGLTLNLKKARVDFELDKFISLSSIQARIGVEKITLNGALMPKWINNIPAFPEVACFVALPGNIKLAELTVDQFDFQPFNNDTFRFSLSQIKLGKFDDEKKQNLIFNYVGTVCKRKFISGNFSGNLSQRKRKLEGRIDACLAGKKLIAEIIGANKSSGFEFSGHLVEGKLDLAVISRWLIPLWQESFPFGFDGIIDLGGSWVYNSRLGFVGNLGGGFQKIRMVAQGLFVTIFELNGSWKLFDENLELSDSGSSFFGFPAVFKGRVSSVFEPDRKFNLSFNADNINLKQLYQDLPWGVKYGMGLPEMSGNASFSLVLSGRKPTIKSSFIGNNLNLKSKKSLYKLNFELVYNSEAEENLNFSFFQRAEFVKGQPDLFSRFTKQNRSLYSAISSKSSVSSVVSGSGISVQNFALSGKLIAQQQKIVDLAGSFHDGNGQLRTIAFHENTDENLHGFVSGKFSFLQLLLIY